MPSRFTYSRWDGTQVGFELGADDVFSEITDDLLYHGDLNAALRRMLQSGFRDRNGERIQGIREMLEKLRRKRKDELERYDLGGVYDDIAQELRDVVDMERPGLDELAREAQESGDARRQEITDEVVQERNLRLDMLPPDLAGQVKDLQEYEFTSSEAREKFEQLVDQLRQQLMQSYFNQMAGAMSDVVRAGHGPDEGHARRPQRPAPGPAGRRGHDAAVRGVHAAPRRLLPREPAERRRAARGDGPAHGGHAGAHELDDPRAAGAAAGPRRALLEDMDLRWQMDQLSQNLQQMFPGAGWGRQYDFSGQDPLGFAEAAQLMNELGDIDQLENLLSGATQPGALAEVDIDRARDLLGDDAARSLDRLAELAKMLEEAGLIEQREGRYELTPAGIRKIGRNALSDIFQKLAQDKMGKHEIERTGAGHERAYETKPYEFGDPFNLDIERTVRNAIGRQGSGTPVRLTPDDFEVERTEHLVRSSTVLMVDLSLSMPMRDNFLAAKKVAMALHSLISTQFPRDFLGIVGFSEVAREIKPEALPEVSWDFVYGTNMQHGFLLARRMLARQSGTKQIIMITDGEPTAHITESGEPLFHYPPIPETIDATLTEVMRCTKEGIRINTFMLDATPYLQNFIEKLTQMNRGRAFFTTPETLGDYVLVDFIEQRRQLSRGRRAS